jgi:hypothetical protein
MRYVSIGIGDLVLIEIMPGGIKILYCQGHATQAFSKVLQIPGKRSWFRQMLIVHFLIYFSAKG